VIMLLNAGVEERTNFSRMAGFGGIPLTLALLVVIATAILTGHGSIQSAAQTGAVAPTRTLSLMLFQDFVYPFELTSFLILVAIIGAIVLAQREKA
jgi:NADH-quinone oxidoreductase subunit J